MCGSATNLDIPGDLEIRHDLDSADDLENPGDLNIRYDLAFADDWSVPPVAYNDVQSS